MQKQKSQIVESNKKDFKNLMANIADNILIFQNIVNRFHISITANNVDTLESIYNIKDIFRITEDYEWNISYKFKDTDGDIVRSTTVMGTKLKLCSENPEDSAEVVFDIVASLEQVIKQLALLDVADMTQTTVNSMFIIEMISSKYDPFSEIPLLTIILISKNFDIIF